MKAPKPVRQSPRKRVKQPRTAHISPVRSQKKVLIKRNLRRTRRLHQRVFLHPLSVMVLLCVGVYMVGWTYRVIADSYSVTAKIAAPALTEGATITSPADGASLTATPITVSGTCPTSSYVKLYTNGLFNGVAWCANDNTFQIAADLFSGTNTLAAQAFNITDEPGPTTPNVTVTYTPNTAAAAVATGPSASSPAATHPNTAASSPATSPALPLLLSGDFHYQTFIAGQTFRWAIDLAGGTPPYTVFVAWGDGQTSTLRLHADPSFQLTHTYKAAGYYAVQLRATDAAGGVRTLQLAALIKSPGSTGIFSTQSGSTASPKGQTSSSGTSLWLWLAWPSFIIVLLMMLSFWLGEREEYKRILSKKKRQHPAYRPL